MPQAFHAETERQNRKRTGYHVLEWIVFLILSAVPVAVPGYKWHTTDFYGIGDESSDKQK